MNKNRRYFYICSWLLWIAFILWSNKRRKENFLETSTPTVSQSKVSFRSAYLQDIVENRWREGDSNPGLSISSGKIVASSLAKKIGKNCAISK